MNPGSGGASEGDERLLRRAARDVAVRIAAAVALVLVGVGVVVVVVGDVQETRSAREATRAVWESADDVDDPPAGTWLVVAGSGGTEVTPGAPSAVQQIDPASLPDGAGELGPDGRGFAVWTGDRSIGRVSAVYDMGPLELRERRVRVSVVAAVLLGAAGAAVVGAVVARRAVRPLGAALSLQRRFVADASHELRTPLSVVLTRAQLLRRRAGDHLDPASRTELDQLVRDTRAMADVIDDLLLAAQLEHGARTRGPVDVVDLGQEVVTSLQPLAVELGLRLRFRSALCRGSTAGGDGFGDRAAAGTDGACSTTPCVTALTAARSCCRWRSTRPVRRRCSTCGWSSRTPGPAWTLMTWPRCCSGSPAARRRGRAVGSGWGWRWSTRSPGRTEET